MSNRIWEIGPDGAPILRQTASSLIKKNEIKMTINNNCQEKYQPLGSLVDGNQHLDKIIVTENQEVPTTLPEGIPNLLLMEDEIADSEEEPELMVVLNMELEILRSQSLETSRDVLHRTDSIGNNTKYQKPLEFNEIDFIDHKTQDNLIDQEIKTTTPSENSQTEAHKPEHTYQHKDPIQLFSDISTDPKVNKTKSKVVLESKSLPKAIKGKSLSALIQKPNAARYRVGLSKKNRVDSLHRVVQTPAPVASAVKPKKKQPSTS